MTSSSLLSTPGAPADFFKTRRSYGEIKQEILGKHFNTWCNTTLATKTTEAEPILLYLDLNVGSEEHDSPELKTSVVNIFESLHRSTGKKQDLNESVRVFFGDPSTEILEQLQQQLDQLPYFTSLIHLPFLLNDATSQEILSELIESEYPGLVFMNPFDISSTHEMLTNSICSWQPDLLMLFTPESIRKALTGKKVSQHLAELFGERLQQISGYCKKEKNNPKREEYILKEFVELLEERNYQTIKFKINEPDKELVNHHLLFSTLNKASYRNFKETLLPYSDFEEDGVPRFVAHEPSQHQLSLFPQQRKFSIQNLIAALAEKPAQYKYKAIKYIYEEHSIGTNYIRENYLTAFEQLQQQGKVELLNPKTLQTIRKPTPASVVKFK